jgi:hypothetical protein
VRVSWAQFDGFWAKTGEGFMGTVENVSASVLFVMSRVFCIDIESNHCAFNLSCAQPDRMHHYFLAINSAKFHT